MAAGVPAALPVGDLVAKRLLKSAFWEPGCGEGWANCVLELVVAVDAGGGMEL